MVVWIVTKVDDRHVWVVALFLPHVRQVRYNTSTQESGTRPSLAVSCVLSNAGVANSKDRAVVGGVSIAQPSAGMARNSNRRERHRVPMTSIPCVFTRGWARCHRRDVRFVRCWR